MRQFKFYCELGEDDKYHWYINLPEWMSAGGPKEALEMVLGADDFLYALAKGESEVILKISEEPYDYSEILILAKNEMESGRYYVYKDLEDQKFRVMWFCDVVLFMFGNKFPEFIYFKKV